jgi:hypothetical protein
MTKNIPAAVLLAAIVLLGACRSTTDPVPMGKDTYMISMSSSDGFSSNGELLAEAIQKAGAFCQTKGLNVEVMNTSPIPSFR